MKKRMGLILAALLASVSMTGVCAETDINAVFEKDVLCDPTSTSSIYLTPPDVVTIKALKSVKWVSGKPKTIHGQKIYAATPGKTWLGFGVKSIIVPSPEEAPYVLGTLVALNGKAGDVAAAVEKALQGKSSDESSFETVSKPEAEQITLRRLVRYRSGFVYSAIVNEIQTPEGPETAVYCALNMVQ